MTTRADCDRAFDNLKDAALAVGYDPERVARWGYSIGSKTYGNTSRLFQVGADTIQQGLNPASDRYPYGSGHYSAGNLPEFLGWGPTDTLDSLRTITRTLWAVAYLKREELSHG